MEPVAQATAPTGTTAGAGVQARGVAGATVRGLAIHPQDSARDLGTALVRGQDQDLGSGMVQGVAVLTAEALGTKVVLADLEVLEQAAGAAILVDPAVNPRHTLETETTVLNMLRRSVQERIYLLEKIGSSGS